MKFDSKKREPKKEIKDETEWDTKRILIGLILFGIFLIIFLEGKSYFLDKNQSVLGDAVTNKSISQKPPKPPSVNVSSNIAPKLNDIKKTIENLDVKDVASSSPQIQKVLNDIKGIKDLPANEAKQACMRICSGL